MATILQDLPYYDDSTLVNVQHQIVQVLPHQIIVWVSLSAREKLVLGASTRRFPAILDTGDTYGFAISQKHLGEWAGLTRQSLEWLGSVNINRVNVPRLAATVWLHPNKKGERDTFRRSPSFCLDLRKGIALYAADTDLHAPRLPLLGLRALDENKLRCFIYGDRLRVTLQTPPKPKQSTTAGSD